MVTLVVATTTVPASIGPASALLAMPGWQAGPSFEGITSFVNGDVRLLQHDKGMVEEDHLDKRWEQASSEVVHELIFLSKHTAVSNRPALTVHPIGVPHLRQGDVPPQGGKPGWAAPPSPRMAPWLKLLKTIAESRGLIPEFEITLEATHHGPETNTPTMFVEIDSQQCSMSGTSSLAFPRNDRSYHHNTRATHLSKSAAPPALLLSLQFEAYRS